MFKRRERRKTSLQNAALVISQILNLPFFASSNIGGGGGGDKPKDDVLCIIDTIKCVLCTFM